MTRRIEARGMSRREALRAAAAVGIVVAAGTPLRVFAAGSDGAVKAVLGDRSAKEGLISLDLPQIAENGNTVPIGVMVDSPMTKDDHVTTVHVFADGNPNPDVAVFHFTPMSGRAQANTRMRLAKTQDIVAVAEMSDGAVYVAKQEVKVTIGGCGG